MHISKTPAGIVRRSARHVPLLDDPGLGHLQSIIMKRLDELGPNAYGYALVEQLSVENGVFIDQAQIYSALRRLTDNGHIKVVETRKQAGTPPLKIYGLTPDGRRALEAAAEHYAAVAAFLNNTKRKPTRT